MEFFSKLVNKSVYKYTSYFLPTHSVDEIILYWVLLLLRGAVHARGSAERFLPNVPSAPAPASSSWGLHTPLDVIGRLRGIAGFDGPQAERAAPHGLSIEQDGEGKLALPPEGVADLIGAVLVVCYLRCGDRSIRAGDLSPQCRVSSLD